LKNLRFALNFLAASFLLGFGPARVLAGQTGLNRMALKTLKKA
jgi:hypothetical protein